MPRSLTDERPSGAYTSGSLADFYREEFLKHRRCLEAQRDCYSACALAEVEAALTQVMGRIEILCRQLAAELGPHGVRVVTLQTSGIVDTIPDYAEDAEAPTGRRR